MAKNDKACQDMIDQVKSSIGCVLEHVLCCCLNNQAVHDGKRSTIFKYRSNTSKIETNDITSQNFGVL